MNSTQLKRSAAFQKLTEVGLIQPDPTRENLPALCHRGSELVKKLARELKVLLNSLTADHPSLQGSLATFEPNPTGSRNVGILSYNGQLDQTEQNFAIAHELAHLILHKGQAVACRHSDFENTTTETSPLAGQVEIYNPKNLREREANTFALELLIPTAELRYEYLQRSQAGGGPAILDTLATYFGVQRGRLLLQLLNVFLGAPLPNPTQAEAATALPRPERTLDNEQLVAAHQDSPALVLAGPGSGKTTTLTERVRYLVEAQKVLPAHLLILTFSNKTAGELRERLARVGLSAHEMLISTFHAYGVDFLRRYAQACNLPADFRLLDKAHSYMLLEDLLGELPSGHYITEHNPTGRFQDILQDISRAKDYLNTPQSYQAAVAQMQLLRVGDNPKYSALEVAKAQERAKIYEIYERYKQQQGLVDFSDLVMKPVLLLQQDPAVLPTERDRYQEILVDEYQDINFASGELLRLLTGQAAGGRDNLWAVGDIHQSIYRFRGAYPAQAGPDNFKQDYSTTHRPAAILELRSNYRSLEPVVQLASHLRQTMPAGATSPMVSMREPLEGGQPVLHYTEFDNTVQETAAIVASIQTHYAEGYSYSSHAILCQRHKQADALALALAQNGISVNRVGQFFNQEHIQECVATVAALSNQHRPAFLRLGRGRLPMLELFGLADQFKLSPRAALTDKRVLDELEPAKQMAAHQLDEMLNSLNNWRNVWRLLTEYLFGWSNLIPELVEQAASNPTARQHLRSIGQVIQLAYAFDQEEEARLVKQARQKAGTTHLTLEQELKARRRLPKAAHRHKFMRYVQALVNSEARLEPEVETQADSDQLDAVHILTAHASKGLEFHFVYLPGLHYRSTPSVTDVPPPGLYRDLYKGQADDEPSLFYVSATRAKDKLFLSWALRDSSEQEAGVTKSPPRHKMHPVLEPVKEFMRQHPHLWQTLEVLPNLPAPENEISTSSNRSVGNVQATAGGFPAHDYWQLQTYSKCPARYYYEHVQKCGGRRDDNQAHFYKGLSQAHIELNRTLSQTGQLPELSQLQKTFNAAWPPAQSTDHTTRLDPLEAEQANSEADADAPVDYYHRNGMQLVAQMFDHYQQALEQTNQPGAIQLQFNQTFQVELSNCRVKFQVDRVENLPGGTRRLIRTRIGPLPDQKKLDEDTDTYRLLTLYALAGGANTQVVLETIGSHGVGQIVADKAAIKAAAYLKIQAGQSKATNLLQQLERNAEGIQSGRFVPNPGQGCQRCPFYTMLCPTRLE